MILNVEKNSTNELQLVPYASKGLHIPFVSQEEYDNLTETEQRDGTFRIVYDDPETPITASDIPTDVISGADNVEDGLKKLVKTRLWHNDNQTESFASQIITLSQDASEFLEIEIIFEYAKITTDVGFLIPVYLRSLGDSASTNNAWYVALSDTDIIEFVRFISLQRNQITFSSTVQSRWTLGGSGAPVYSTANKNDFMIPIDVYGYSSIEL